MFGKKKKKESHAGCAPGTKFSSTLGGSDVGSHIGQVLE